MNNIFSEHIIKAVSDGLLYSLALGILLAAVTGIIVLSTRKASARVRYNLLVSALLLFAGAVLFSFIKQLTVLQTPLPIYTNLDSSIFIASYDVTTPFPGNDYIGITGFFHAHANTIFLIWSLIVMVKAFQLITGLQSLSLLKRNKISPAGEQWEELVRTLSKNLGIQRVVRIAASGIAKVPMVIGHLKPVILLPVGLVTSLSPESIEAIIVHELAHIRRRDWLVNLLVSGLEVIFFFNPAVLWISSLIRTERENCCDDIAITYTGSKTSYIDTLVACQEFQLSSPSYSLAFSGQKKPLLARVKRMISNRNTSLSRTERGIMAASLVITFIGIIALTSGSKKEKNNLASSVMRTEIDSMYNDKTISRSASDSMITRLDSLSSLKDSLPFLEIPDHPGSVYNDSLMSEVDKAAQNNNRQTSVYPPANGEFIVYQSHEVDDHTDVTIPNADVLTRLVKLDSILYQVNTQSGKLTSLQVNGNTVAPARQLGYLQKISRLTSDKKSYTSHQPYTTYDDKQQNYQPFNEESNLNKLVAVLIKANIIHHKEELLSFKLSDTEFIMNDIKMPDAIYLPLRKAFVQTPANGKKGSWAWMYNFKT